MNAINWLVEKRFFGSFFNSEKKKGFWYAFYIALHLAMLYNPLERTRNEVTRFSRVIGAGFNAGIDVSRRISNFNRWFLLFCVLLLLFCIAVNHLMQRELYGEHLRTAVLLDRLIVIANVVAVFRYLTYFYDESQTTTVFYYGDTLLMGILLLGFVYIALGLGEKICLENFEALHVIGWMLAFPVTMVLAWEWDQGRNFMNLQFLVSILIVLTVRFSSVQWNESSFSKKTGTMAAIMAWILFCTSLYIEAIVWLNQRAIFVTHLRRYYVFSVFVGVLTAAFAAFFLGRKNRGIQNWKAIAYPAIIFGVSCIWLQIPFSRTYNVDLFESANFSILISDFLNFGTIPIVEHYGGHMMSGVWEGILYAFLNNDVAGAVFSPYASYGAVVIVLAFYYFLKNFWDEDAAFFTTLFFPFYGSISYWGLGLLTALAAMHYIRKNTYFRAALFWGVCIWCALYRLDLGYAFVLAGMAVLLLCIVIDRNKIAVKQLGLTLCAWGTAGLSVWSVLCVMKGISPIDRLIEFLQINLSNQNWAYVGIGEVSLAKYSFTYIFMPLLMVVALSFAVFQKRIREFLGMDRWILMLVPGISYFCNFSRGLVRHSVAEDAMSCIWTAYLFLALFAAAFTKKKKLLLPLFAACILLQSLFSSQTVFSENSMANRAMSNLGNFTDTWTIHATGNGEMADKTYWVRLWENQEIIERVQWGEDGCGEQLQNTVNAYRGTIDALLEPEETFVDFINKTSLYPLLGRRDPVYVSQSPLQLSGEFTQEQFVKEMEGIPIVLMPYDWNNLKASQALDGVPNLYRYYKVAEYIYQNYVPLCTYQELYAVWCLPERYDKMQEKVTVLAKAEMERENLSEVSDASWKLVSYGYDGPFESEEEGLAFMPALHTYGLNKLPLLWAEADTKKSAENPVLTELNCKDGLYHYSLDQREYGANGNYLKVTLAYDPGESAEKAKDDEVYIGATLLLGKMVDGNFETKYQYGFSVFEGQHDYMFRVSNDYYWYVGELDTVKLECEGELTDIEMRILEGD